MLPENWEAVQVFTRLSTQWRTGPWGGVLGLDYPGLESIMRMLKVEDAADCFSRIQIMEAEALKILNKKKPT